MGSGGGGVEPYFGEQAAPGTGGLRRRGAYLRSRIDTRFYAELWKLRSRL